MPDRMHPDELVATADERGTLAAFLDLQRDVITDKLTGITEQDARRRLVPSLTTLGGVAKHLRWVEVGWFQQVFAARSGDNRRAHDRNSEFVLEPAETVASVIDGYRAACARSRAVSAGHDLDETAPHVQMGEVSLRWIYVHLIEETARHAGQMDILREQIEATAR